MNKTSIKIVTLFLSAILLVFGAYCNHFHNTFHFDDGHVIENNLYIRDLHHVVDFFKDARFISSVPSNQQYRPMIPTSLAIDYAIAGRLDPFWFQCSAFIWFLIQCALMYHIFVRIITDLLPRSTARVWALFTTTLYGVHTANAETLNYICARSDSMSTAWLVIALTVFIQWPSLRRWGCYILPWIIGCLFKQTAIVFPALLTLYVLFFEMKCGFKALYAGLDRKRIRRDLIRSTGPAWCLGLLLMCWIKSMDPPTYTPGGASVWAYLITQPYVMLHYFFTFFLPFQLSADTDWVTLSTLWDDRFYVGLLFLIGSVVAIFRFSESRLYRPIAYGMSWFFIALLPTSSVIPLAEVMNDHRVFFPFIGLCLAVCWSGYVMVSSRGLINRRSMMAVFLGILCAFAYGTYQRNKVWATEVSLWKDVTEKSPKNGRGLMNYGLTLLRQGDFLSAKNYFERALVLTPRYGTLHTNLGIVNDRLGLTKEAEKHFQLALQYDPNNPSLLGFYGAHYEQKNPSLAEHAYLKAIQLSPGHLDLRARLMNLYWRQEAWFNLKTAADQVLTLVPQDPFALRMKSYALNHTTIVDVLEKELRDAPSVEGYLGLSQMYYAKKAYYLSIKAAQNALALSSQSAAAYNNLCAAYNGLHAYTQAEKYCRKALKLDPDSALIKNNLSLSLKKGILE